MTKGGFWTADKLAEWGVMWKPPVGWRDWLAELYAQEGHIVHDTIFDQHQRVAWVRMRMRKQRIPVVYISDKDKE